MDSKWRGCDFCNTDVLTGERVKAEVRNLKTVRVSSLMQAEAMVMSGGTFGPGSLDGHFQENASNGRGRLDWVE